jgi:hypothetical protein
MPRVRFEPTVSVFERAKTVHALDRAANVIGILRLRSKYFSQHNVLKHSYSEFSLNARNQVPHPRKTGESSIVCILILIDTNPFCMKNLVPNL